MAHIVSVTSTFSEAEAIRQFCGGRVQRWWRPWRRRLVGVRVVYIPYRLFRVSITNRGQTRTRWLALDAVMGWLDPYQFDAPWDELATEWVETEHALPVQLSDEQMRPMMLERVRRWVYGEGFFRLRDVHIEVEPVGRVVHIPYWVGIYRRGDRFSIEVIDGLQKRRQGAKVRDVILKGL
ncbi:MAG: hypothetical protein D6723_15025 [Acidobacteria bacterium]|nr:MAG: hypothetical protein D6723_15025 [Acidobacteriota bacterium]